MRSLSLDVNLANLVNGLFENAVSQKEFIKLSLEPTHTVLLICVEHDTIAQAKRQFQIVQYYFRSSCNNNHPLLRLYTAIIVAL